MRTKRRSSARSYSAFVALIGVLLMSSGFAIIATASTANATGQGQSICHPNGSPSGWTVIPPDAASAHIRNGAPKHKHGGRVDVYAVNGECPSVPPTECDEGEILHNGECVTPDDDCDEPNEINDEGECVPPTVCDEGTVLDPETGQCVVVEGPTLCEPGTDRAGEPVGTEPCSQEVSPPKGGTKTPTKTTTAAAVTPSVVHAGIGNASADLGAIRTDQGLALVLAGALVMLAGGLGMARRRGVLAGN